MRTFLIALIALAACAATPPPETADEATAQDTCGMARYQHLIGQDAGTIDRSRLPARTRIITPDMMVTQDFSPQRLNIMVGTDGKIGSMRCF